MRPMPSATMDVLNEFFEDATELDRPVLQPRVLLASQSPRRRQLLLEYGIEFETVSAKVDDGLLVRGGVSPSEWVAALGYFKAAAAMRDLGEWPYAPGEVIIVGADTIVLKGNQIIGQPRSAVDAERILRLLENGSHSVLTGVAMIDAGSGQRDMFVDRATVQVGEIGHDAIRAYVDSGAWRGKAGAYNLRERLDASWPITYSGDPTTIMGLPMGQLKRRLVEFADRCAKSSLV
ncbi:MAG: nucleoside triphosphate pyrophosphatase [Phycisphaerales bacterium]